MSQQINAFEKAYRRRWLIWIVACLAHTIGMFHRASLTPMADRIMADFNISAFAFGGLGAAYFYIYAAMQLPSGTLADTLGPRKTITTGLLLSGVGSLIMGFAPTFGVLYLGRVIISFGVSIVWLNVIKLVMEWFPSRQVATTIGLSSSIMLLGQIVATTPLALLIMAAGWRASLATSAVVTFALAASNWLIVRNSPAQMGLPPLSELEGLTAVRVAPLEQPPDLSLGRRFKIILGNKYLWPLMLVGLGVFGAYATLFYNWTIVYLMQIYDLPRDSAASFILVVTIGIMIGSPTIGFLSDKVLHRRRLPIIVFAGVVLACCLTWALWNGGRPPLGVLYLLSFLIGFGNGAVFLNFACVKDIIPSYVQGIALGLLNMGAFIGPAIAQPLFGYILDQGWKGEIVEGVRVYPLSAFQQGFFLCCGLALLGFISALLTKETYARR